ncbi:sulfatase, partial [Acidobacteriota bacterium]
GDNVDIDYIRFISKKARYLQKPIGTVYETKKNEMHRVLFSRTPLAVTFELELPDGSHFMTFGMGILENANPVTFKILINGSKEIFSRQVISTDRWHDAGIDMSPYAGQKLQIIFKTESRQDNVAFWSNPMLYSQPKEKFNVIIVLEDALRADHMSCYGYYRDTTPVKKRFAKQGVLFQNAFAQATKTRSSCPSIMTSLHPTATGVWKFFESLHENYLTLAEILRHTGFQTAAFIENGNAGPSVGLHQGFSYLFRTYLKVNKTRDMYTKNVIQWIKKHNELNYFIYLHLTDPHGPYDPPEKFRRYYNDSPLSGKKITKVREYDPHWVTSPTQEGRRACYDGEIKNNDFYFERFLNDLKELNSLDHTLIIFISDHGEHLGEHDLWGHHPPGFAQGIKIPMIMVYPKKLPRNLIINQPVQNLDIVPTILDLTGINKDNLLLAGDSLLPLIGQEKLDSWNNRIIVSDEVYNRSTRNDRRELASIIYKDTHILSSDTVPLRRFNYLTDKEEIKGITVSHKLREIYKSFIRDLQGKNCAIWQAMTKKTSAKVKYDPETIKHLKSLGYIE